MSVFVGRMIVMAEIITAPDPIPLHKRPAVFLAGGIQLCDPWQAEVCNELKHSPGAIYNLRRVDFGDWVDSIVREQIAWQSHAIQAFDVFRVWFCASASV